MDGVEQNDVKFFLTGLDVLFVTEALARSNEITLAQLGLYDHVLGIFR